MIAGLLRHQVEIFSLVETQSTNTGEMVQSWSSLGTVWASIESLKGQEKWAAAQRQSTIDTKITIRYLSGVSVKGKIVYGSITYMIESIINIDERNRELQIMCYRVGS